MGYFAQPRSHITGPGGAARLEADDGAPLDFRVLRGVSGWRAALAALYARDPHAWSTPAELFAPYYSRAIARWLLEAHEARARRPGQPGSPSHPPSGEGRAGGRGAGSPLRVVELGPGRWV